MPERPYWQSDLIRLGEEFHQARLAQDEKLRQRQEEEARLLQGRLGIEEMIQQKRNELKGHVPISDEELIEMKEQHE